MPKRLLFYRERTVEMPKSMTAFGRARGCSADDIVGVVAITCVQAQANK